MSNMPAENELEHWNYRIVRHKTDIGYTYLIHEAYYDSQGKVHAITEDEVGPSGDTLEELKSSFELYKQAFEKPVLDYDSIPEPEALPIDAIGVQDLNRVAPKASDIIQTIKEEK